MKKQIKKENYGKAYILIADRPDFFGIDAEVSLYSTKGKARKAAEKAAKKAYLAIEIKKVNIADKPDGNQQDYLWLSTDEAVDNDMDYALFHNKKIAEDYLACRFVQALKAYGLNETDKDKIKKDVSSFMIEGTSCNCYGKIIKLKLN